MDEQLYIEKYSQQSGLTTVSENMLYEFVRDYIDYFKKDNNVVSFINAKLKLSLNHPEDKDDEKRILNYLNKGKTPPVIINAYIFNNWEEHDKFKELLVQENYLFYGDNKKQFNEVNKDKNNIQEAWVNIELAGQSTIAYNIFEENFRKHKSTERIMNSIWSVYPWFVKGSGRNFRQYQRREIK